MERRDGRRRIVIERVSPTVDCGTFPVKRTAGDDVRVEADVFADGHDEIAVELLFRRDDDPGWTAAPMRDPDNDRWRGSFAVPEVGAYVFTVRAWVDAFASWHRDLAKRLAASQDVAQELLVGHDLVRRAARRADPAGGEELRAWARRLRDAARDGSVEAVPDEPAMPFPELASVMERNPDRRAAVTFDPELRVVVERERARYSTWYELFPRSTADEPARHGTFKDVERRLPYVAGMGFDVLYLPPVHPVGRSFRKGRNNTTEAAPGDPGSPWAIGGPEGGHTAIHPDLGTIEDFERLLRRTRDFGMEIAMDLAYQCSADHPWLTEHPEWFRHRPDGTIRHAENPPKQYQDIYPIDFETRGWRDLWDALKGVVDFWIGRGVRAFRVDNPHTKPFVFWEWLLDEVRREHPDVIFLAEAFTRPKVMNRLAKIGFTQSYTYFTWRNSKAELLEYFGRDLPAVREFFRPNLWPNTPDILHDELQTGGRPAFQSRLVLAATLGASYGIYGPPFELMEHVAVAPGKEEYVDSEKYEIRTWDVERADSLAELIARVNRIRREHPALQRDDTLRFHDVDNDMLIAYSKTAPDGSDRILAVVSLDRTYVQAGWVDVRLDALGLEPDEAYAVRDLLTGARYAWSGSRNFVQLDPDVLPAHVFCIERAATATGDATTASRRRRSR